MKKKFLVILLAVFAVSLSFVILSQKANSEKSFLSQNVEALAQDESGQIIYAENAIEYPEVVALIDPHATGTIEVNIQGNSVKIPVFRGYRKDRRIGVVTRYTCPYSAGNKCKVQPGVYLNGEKIS